MAKQAQKPKDVSRRQPPVNSSASSGVSHDKSTLRRPVRAELTPEETRARMEAFTTEREEAFIAAIREDES